MFYLKFTYWLLFITFKKQCFYCIVWWRRFSCQKNIQQNKNKSCHEKWMWNKCIIRLQKHLCMQLTQIVKQLKNLIKKSKVVPERLQSKFFFSFFRCIIIISGISTQQPVWSSNIVVVEVKAVGFHEKWSKWPLFSSVCKQTLRQQAWLPDSLSLSHIITNQEELQLTWHSLLHFSAHWFMRMPAA